MPTFVNVEYNEIPGGSKNWSGRICVLSLDWRTRGANLRMRCEWLGNQSFLMAKVTSASHNSIMYEKQTCAERVFGSIRILFEAQGCHKWRLGVQSGSNSESRVQAAKYSWDEKEFPKMYIRWKFAQKFAHRSNLLMWGQSSHLLSINNWFRMTGSPQSPLQASRLPVGHWLKQAGQELEQEHLL